MQKTKTQQPLYTIHLLFQLFTTILLVFACYVLLLYLLPNTTPISSSLINTLFSLPLLSNLFISSISLLELYSISTLMTLLFGVILIMLASHFLMMVALTNTYKQLLYQMFSNILLWGCLIIFIPATTYLDYLSSLYGQHHLSIQQSNYLSVIDSILVDIHQPKISATIAFSAMLEDFKDHPEFVATLDSGAIKPYTTTLNQLVILKGGVMNKEEHYLRNVLNRAPLTLDDMLLSLNEGWVLMSPVNSAYHMYGHLGEYNVKFVSADGHFEAVYNKDGVLLTQENDAKNMATYNFASHYQDKTLHKAFDVKPYQTWGNTPSHPASSLAETALNVARYYGNKEAKAHYETLQDIVLNHQKK